jgi:uncharacterized membrane protein
MPRRAYSDPKHGTLKDESLWRGQTSRRDWQMMRDDVGVSRPRMEERPLDQRPAGRLCEASRAPHWRERKRSVSDLVAIAYEDLPTAQQVASNLGEAVKGHEIELDDLVIVERNDDGKVKLHQPSLAGFGAASGALWGGLIGLIFLVPLFGMAIGAAAGGAGGALSDTGVDDDFMKRLGEELQPGKAALIVLVREVSADKVLPQIQVPGTVIQTSLSDEDEQRLQQALDAARA